MNHPVYYRYLLAETGRRRGCTRALGPAGPGVAFAVLLESEDGSASLLDLSEVCIDVHVPSIYSNKAVK